MSLENGVQFLYQGEGGGVKRSHGRAGLRLLPGEAPVDGLVDGGAALEPVGLFGRAWRRDGIGFAGGEVDDVWYFGDPYVLPAVVGVGFWRGGRAAKAAGDASGAAVFGVSVPDALLAVFTSERGPFLAERGDGPADRSLSGEVAAEIDL